MQLRPIEFDFTVVQVKADIVFNLEFQCVRLVRSPCKISFGRKSDDRFMCTMQFKHFKENSRFTVFLTAQGF